jgi:hypothetical protein
MNELFFMKAVKRQLAVRIFAILSTNLDSLLTIALKASHAMLNLSTQMIHNYIIRHFRLIWKANSVRLLFVISRAVVG